MRRRPKYSRSTGYDYAASMIRNQETPRGGDDFEPTREYRVVGTQFEGNSIRDSFPAKGVDSRTSVRNQRL